MYRTCSKSDIGRITQIRLAECICWRAAVYPIFQSVLSDSQVQKGLHTHSSCSLCASSLMWWSPVFKMTQECQVDLFSDLSRAQEFQTPNTTPLTLLTAATGLPTTCKFEGHCSIRGFATMASTGENRDAAVVLLLPSCCAIFFYYYFLRWHLLRPIGEALFGTEEELGHVGRGQELLSCISLNIWIQLPHCGHDLKRA